MWGSANFLQKVGNVWEENLTFLVPSGCSCWDSGHRPMNWFSLWLRERTGFICPERRSCGPSSVGPRGSGLHCMIASIPSSARILYQADVRHKSIRAGGFTLFPHQDGGNTKRYHPRESIPRESFLDLSMGPAVHSEYLGLSKERSLKANTGLDS